MDDPAIATAAIEEQISALSGFSMELTVEDLQKWIKAYKEVKSHVATYSKLY